MAMPQHDLRVRPSAWWYAVTVVLWIASFVVFIVAIGPIISIFSAGVDQVQNNRPVAVPDDGFTVYVSASAPNATCFLADGAGQIRLAQFDQADADNFTFSFDNGPDVHPLATTPKDIEAGTYTLSCRGVPNTAVLATGERLDFHDFAVRLGIGLIVSILCGLVGLIWLIVMLVKRHNSKQRVRQAQAAGAYGYGAGYPPGSYPGYVPGGYQQGPQGGYQQGGYGESAPYGSSQQGPEPDAPGAGYSAAPPPPPPAGAGSASESGEPPPDQPERRE